MLDVWSRLTLNKSDVPAASGEVAAWRGMCGGESRSEVQSGQLRVQHRNPVSFGAGFHTQCNGESFVVCGCAFMVAVKCGESVSQDDLPLHEIGINGNCLFGCEKSRVGLFVGECLGSARKVSKRRGQRCIERAAIHKDAVVNCVDRSHFHKGLKRTKDDGAELVPRQRSGAHQDRCRRSWPERRPAVRSTYCLPLAVDDKGFHTSDSRWRVAQSSQTSSRGCCAGQGTS